MSLAPRSLVLSIALAATTSANAQPALANPESTALRSCVAFAEQRNADSALVIGKRAEAIYRQRITANARDTDALVGLARVLSQCFLPSASFLTQGQLSSDAMELLDNAIEVDANHWLARFTLASIAYRSPAFLGRGKRAAQELDYLLRLQGDRNDDPLFARVFEMRGRQLERDGQADSARALWTRGARLFPSDRALQALAGKDGSPAAAPNAAPTAPSTSTLAAVRVTARPVGPPSTLPSVREVPRSQVLLAAGGTADVMQAVQLLPGATRVGEGSDIYTRGGDAAETQLLLNGGRMLSLSRFEGLNGGMFGALEPFVVRSVRYSSGGFSARYGNALSGVIDIETDGRPRERATRAGLSLVQAAGTFRLPFNKRVGGWINSRFSHTGALLAAHGRGAEFDGSPHSQEAVASLIANPSATSEIRATALVEADDSRRILDAAGWRGPFHSSGNTRAAVLSTRWMAPSAPVLVRSSLAASDRSSDMTF
ncbi:MAG: TonB-dependent receptor plug domain-containing protein, partial [Gemmatimonadota bacterium]